MSEEKVVPKKKPGRPKKNPLAPPKSVLGNALIAEDHPADVPKKKPQDAINKGWFSGRAVKIRIFGQDGEGEEVVVKLGDSPFLRIRRNMEVIVPFEVLSVLDDSVVDMPRTRWYNGKPVGEYIEKITRFPYANMGEVPWSEYVAFREGERKKPMQAVDTGHF